MKAIDLQFSAKMTQISFVLGLFFVYIISSLLYIIYETSTKLISCVQLFCVYGDQFLLNWYNTTELWWLVMEGTGKSSRQESKIKMPTDWLTDWLRHLMHDIRFDSCITSTKLLVSLFCSSFHHRHSLRKPQKAAPCHGSGCWQGKPERSAQNQN